VKKKALKKEGEEMSEKEWNTRGRMREKNAML